MNSSTISQLDLFGLGGHVWNSLAALRLLPAPMQPVLRHGLQYYVGVSMGELGPSLLLGADSDAAATLAAAMFDVSSNALRADDVVDALGEAANTLAGKIAQLLGEADGVGLPEQLFVPYMATYLQRSEILNEIGAQSEGHRIYIAITQNSDQLPVGE